jgi:ABC-type transport system involved in multi-copper enzyme maturation permease subunit
MSIVDKSSAQLQHGTGSTGRKSTTSLPASADDDTLAVTQRRVIASEWLKLRTVRSWLIMIISSAVLLIAFGALAASVASGAVDPADGSGGGDGGSFGSSDPTALSLAGVGLVQLIVGILGVLFISNEYANGMIRSSFAAVPKRLPVLWAKAIVLAAVLAIVMVISSLAAFLTGQAILGDATSTTLGAENVLRAVIGSGLYLAGIAVFGVAVGAIMRNTAGSIAVVVAALLIIPGLAGLVLPESWRDTITPYLPSSAGEAFTSVNSSDALLSAGAGAAVFSAWLVALLIGAAVLIRRRDA